MLQQILPGSNTAFHSDRADSCSPSRARWAVPVVALVVMLCGAELRAQATTGVDFARDVQPILARHCYQCHGPNRAESGLRLHEREAALASLESGQKAIVPHHPEQSALLSRVNSKDEAERMPPEGKPLTATQIELLRKWVDAGAPWQQPWAFSPVVRPEAPKVQRQNWVRTPVDAFILARLEAQGLEPSPEADKAAWLRRATLDLTGLLPTWEELQAFLADDSDQAHARVVDRLLASPRYGERWARHWLDVVRFAETNSFERDNPKPHAWRFRDYVIRSLNDDKPYDRFVQEQLAGDELPDATPDSLIATGFYRLGLWDDEPADRDLARFDELDDLVSTTGQAFLGLTINCARCHDHKIDPLSQKDYYQLLAFFHNVRPMTTTGPNIEVPLFADPTAQAEYQQRVEELQQRRDAVQRQVSELLSQFSQKWTEQGQSQLAQVDLDGLEYRYYRDSWQKLPDFDTLKPESIGKLPRGLFDISPSTRNTAFGFVYTGTLLVPRDGRYTFFLDSDDGSRLSLDGRMLLEYDGIHGTGQEKKANIQLSAGRIPIRLDYFQNLHGLGLSVAWQPPGEPRRPLSVQSTGKASNANLEELVKQHGQRLLGEEPFARYRQKAAELETLKREKVPVELALAVTENGTRAPETFVLERGNPGSPSVKVVPAFPAVLGGGEAPLPQSPPTSNSSGRRLALAHWLTSPDNRLTARVLVNRLWQHHFGRGLVRSPNNFGGMGIPPTHPELIDYLASELVSHGWRLKPLHRQLMLSACYRLQTKPSAAALARDPANDWYSHFDPRRLSAEEVRDCVLQTTGALNLTMYGPGIYPEIAAEVLAGQSRPGSGWGKSSPEEQSRRSIYIHVKRSLVTPLLSAFDFPDTDFSCEARFSTTQPAQSLSMLNGKFLNDQAARLVAELEQKAGDTTAERLNHVYRQVFCRLPSAEEQHRAEAFLSAMQSRHGQSAQTAWKLYCLTLLNRNEFLYVD